MLCRDDVLTAHTLLYIIITMSYAEKSLSVFRQDYHGLRLNCAQAVCHGAGRDDLIELMAQCGGGKAPEQRCGALHAAQFIAGSQKSEKLLAVFLEQNGAVTCSELKMGKKVSCQDCVRTASSILEGILQN